MGEPSQFGQRRYRTSCFVNVRLQFRYATKMDRFYMLLELVFINVVNTFTDRAQKCVHTISMLSLQYIMFPKRV